MENNYNIRDESGDKKYFTQIPNMIVNHSSAYEQSLYLIMKRLAGEHGSCFASLNWLRLKMGVAKRTVSETIDKLLKRKWIKEVKGKKVKGGIVRQFIIVDLWKINIEEYESGTQMTTLKRSGTYTIGSGTNMTKSGTHVTESGTQMHPKKNYTNNYNKNSLSKGKPYFQGNEMRWKGNKWWVLPSDGSSWLEFAGLKEEIEWE